MSPTCEYRALSRKLRALFAENPELWWSVCRAASAIGCEPDQIRSQLRRAVTRGELLPRYFEEGGRTIVEYRHRALLPSGRRHPVRSRMLKAIHITGTFTYQDIARMAGTDMGYVSKTVKPLIGAGHLAVVGRQLFAGGKNPAIVYHVVDRDRFRREVIG